MFLRRFFQKEKEKEKNLDPDEIRAIVARKIEEQNLKAEIMAQKELREIKLRIAKGQFSILSDGRKMAIPVIHSDVDTQRMYALFEEMGFSVEREYGSWFISMKGKSK